MKILTINTYAGSLLIAAQQDDLDEVVGSYEDVGYGSKIQADNFPSLRVISTRSAWPKQDLSDTVVIGHPPCAAFSIMSVVNEANVLGTAAPAFACTIDLLRYAFDSCAQAVAIESVPRALEGARAVHDALANEYGYDVYRVLQNAASFGVGQWRPRFWCVFVQKALGHRPMTWYLKPDLRTCGQVLDELEGEGYLPFVQADRQFHKACSQLLAAGFSQDQVRALLTGAGGYGQLHTCVWRYLGKPCKSNEVREQVKRKIFGGAFEHQLPNVFDPNGYAPTLISSCCWTYRGRPLSIEGYKALMGFPLDYKIDRNPSQLREWLSRGVCPPVARWVLRMVKLHLRGIRITRFPDGAVVKVIAPGELADFRPKKVNCG